MLEGSVEDFVAAAEELTLWQIGVLGSELMGMSSKDMPTPEKLQQLLDGKPDGLRTASQEIIQQPLLVSGDTATIKGRSARVWVIALNKFTIPDEKHFEMEVLEKNGGRHLYIRIYNRQLMLAKEF